MSRTLAFGLVLILVGWGIAAEPGKKPANDLGFTAAFEAEVKAVGQISPDEFGRRFEPKNTYLPKLSFDPTTARFWELFTMDPAEFHARKPITDPNSRKTPFDFKKSGHLYDFRLNPKELAIFKDKGFVISERMGSHSFTDFYYRLYVRDLPVFITSDSILHAWHRYFDRMLESVENNYFRPEFKQMLAAMAAQIPAAKAEYAEGPLTEALADADFFLAVARQMLDPTKGGESALGQAKRVSEAIGACHREEMEYFKLFGRVRTIDFSQFKPRGRYEESETMKDYFRGVMWLGRIDFRIAGGETPEQDRRELAGAIVLHDLLGRAKMTERWQQLDRVLLHMIGKSDSLNASQLGVVLNDAAIAPKTLTERALEDLRLRILDSKIGEQHIRGEWFVVDPFNPQKFALPRSFAFMGQRFVLDSWMMSKIVFDDILWTNPTTAKTDKVKRRIPSSLDVGFAIFGNDGLTPLLVERMKNPAGRKFRDGLPYQHNLAAARNIIERMPETMWKESIYADWLGCLRELSKPTTGASNPESMRTKEWALKTTATQFASWTQLKHDTILYAKPSYSAGEACEYPAGYVEPVPHFWKRFEEMLQRTRAIVAKTTFPDENYKEQGKYFREHQLRNLDNFLKAATMLRAIAEKEVAQQELTSAEAKFLKDTVVRGGGSGRPPVSGWYSNLFSKRARDMSQDDAHKWVALVTDVHTDPPAPISGDPGCVIHQGVGNVDAMLIAIDNGKDRMVYAGPVFSHYEFEAPNAVRHTNSDWQTMLREGKGPRRPEWTAGFVVPGVNPDVKDYGKVDKRWGQQE